MTVQETGRPPLKCRILKMWHQPDGSRAFQVQAVANGEIITIVQPKLEDPDSPPQTKIYHWGDECKAPPGAPPAPVDATVFAANGDVINVTPRIPLVARVTSPAVWASAPASQPAASQPTVSQPTPTPRLTPAPSASPMVASAHGRAWPPAYEPETVDGATKPSPVQMAAVDPRPTENLVKKPAAPVMPDQTKVVAPTKNSSAPKADTKVVVTEVVREGDPRTPVVTPPTNGGKTGAGSGATTTAQLPKEAHPAVDASKPGDTKPAPKPTDSADLANLNDAHKSWGRLEPQQPAPVVKGTTSPGTVAPKVDQPARTDAVTKSTQPAKADVAKKPDTTPTMDLPHAEPKKIDPLQEPDRFARVRTNSDATTAKKQPAETPKPEQVVKNTTDADHVKLPLNPLETAPAAPVMPPFSPGVAPYVPGAASPAVKAPVTPPASPVVKAPVTPAPLPPVVEGAKPVQVVKNPTVVTPPPAPLPSVVDAAKPVQVVKNPTTGDATSQKAPVITPVPAPVIPPATPQPKPADSKPPVPLGMASIMAAQTTEEPSTPSQPNQKGSVAASVAVWDNGNAFSQAPPTTPAQPSNAWTAPPNAPIQSVQPTTYAQGQQPMPPAYVQQPQMMQPMPQQGTAISMDRGVPSGMGNAFTSTTGARPIPSDFGRTSVEANAFSGPAQSMASPQVAMANPYAGQRMAAVAGRPQPAAAQQPPSDALKLTAVLRDAMLPSQREWAVDSMAAQRGYRSNPEVVQALLTGAKDDPAATVRAACVRAIAELKINTPAAVQVVQSLKNDSDQRVRSEAEQALPVLMGGQPQRLDPSVRPVSGN
jgi:hypothetical protein